MLDVAESGNGRPENSSSTDRHVAPLLECHLDRSTAQIVLTYLDDLELLVMDTPVGERRFVFLRSVSERTSFSWFVAKSLRKGALFHMCDLVVVKSRQMLTICSSGEIGGTLIGHAVHQMDAVMNYVYSCFYARGY